MKHIAKLIKGISSLREADEDGELTFLEDKLDELRTRAKGIEPPAVRLQAAMRSLAECQVKMEKAERHLADAQVGFDRAEKALATAQRELEEEQRALAPPAGPLRGTPSLSKDFYDELLNIKAAAQWDSNGNVVLPHSMLQSLFLTFPCPATLQTVLLATLSSLPSIWWTASPTCRTSTTRTTASRRRASTTTPFASYFIL